MSHYNILFKYGNCKRLLTIKSKLRIIIDNRKSTTFHLKDDNGKLWVQVLVTFLDAGATVCVLTTNNKDDNLVETRTVHFA